MSRYIDKDKILDNLNWFAPEPHKDSISSFIEEQPEADVVEVKHGFWEQGDFYDYGDVCSKCEYDSRIESCKYNYCPNCGVKMSGDY